LIDGPKTADNIAEQTTFSNVIKVLATNFRAMSYCGVKLPDILEQESYNSFVLEFKRSITYVIENGYSKEGSDIKTCGGLWEDLYAACQDIMTFSIQLVNSDPQAVVSNLAS
jgi:F0F1-type ATP synthase alpha subunit